MKNKLLISIGILIFSLIWVLVLQFSNSEVTPDSIPGSCTIFSASVGDKVLFGNNEDYYKPKTYLWTESATDDNYGCLYLGFKAKKYSVTCCTLRLVNITTNENILHIAQPPLRLYETISGTLCML